MINTLFNFTIYSSYMRAHATGMFKVNYKKWFSGRSARSDLKTISFLGQPETKGRAGYNASAKSLLNPLKIDSFLNGAETKATDRRQVSKKLTLNGGWG